MSCCTKKSMKMTSFNELNKGLEGAQSTNKKEEVDALADQLLAQGIATSKMEALEKAKGMVQADSRINKEFSEKKEGLTTYNDPRNNPEYNPYRAAIIKELREKALTRKPIHIQNEFQTPSFEKKSKKSQEQ